MTPRSSKHHQQSKTSTISRRFRNRADQAISSRPPEIPQLRGVRSRRAATLPAPRHNPVDNQTPEPHPSSLAWDAPDVLENSPRNTSNRAVEENPPCNLLLSQSLDFPSYESPQGLRSELLPNTDDTATRNYQLQPTPRRSTLSSSLPSVSSSHDFELRLSTDPEQPHDPFLELQDMSALDFMMPPSQYGMNHYGSPAASYSPSYPPQQSYADPRSSASGPYNSSYASSSAMPNEIQQRRPDEHTVLPPYQSQTQPLPRSPYQQQQPLNTMRGGSTLLTSAAHTYSYSAPNQPLGSNSATYPPQPLYPPASYGMGEYQPLPTMYPPSSTTPAAYPAYGSSHDIPQPPASSVPALASSPGTQNNTAMPRILTSRPKPQCWEHGCNGRQFSTFSNLLRHQREKSGTASKSYCPRCGAEFTRTTARNGHMAHDKCKPRRASESSH
ncbi:uncharacterized protein K460DRAFT_290819 [Cucurbitaria berberidis CBS 394.84]|uniref:C2H2-type domain-containing protein n=1 Tax=Cucurbitaria berberidis CBS 394.84 TaxID=1168544 RepID=A0A9P4GEE6_9PLEO|nr:uncharacterized protein K460DRAFT_290819 [Cucurbitaria berberidis CBS 394.84]KAF1843729.1 hypothetical protein K460DRAFT_290819 [Cucurbitaria berberidis CBS 394.84]